ncbi:MAG TPA: hypothetical protein VGU02_06380 [Gaiellaceae bacterium]|nr:hypothetical protein [Gaiellaceae bacterium]
MIGSGLAPIDSKGMTVITVTVVSLVATAATRSSAERAPGDPS